MAVLEVRMSAGENDVARPLDATGASQMKGEASRPQVTTWSHAARRTAAAPPASAGRRQVPSSWRTRNGTGHSTSGKSCRNSMRRPAPATALTISPMLCTQPYSTDWRTLAVVSAWEPRTGTTSGLGAWEVRVHWSHGARLAVS
jgi:hypothetical protein